MKKVKRALSLALAVLMAASMAACAGTPSSSSSQSPESSASKEESESSAEGSEASGSEAATPAGDPITIAVFSMPSNTSGIQNNWYSNILKEKLNVEINLLPSGDQGEQKLQALMASGSLPDIVVFKEYSQVVNAVAGDMLLAYDDYKDLLPDLYANAAKSLQYFADNVSDGKGKAYSVGNAIKTQLPPVGTLNWGPYLRYDIYKQIGSPEINTYTDYLAVVKQMQEVNPTNPDGKKVYGFSLWSDWDNHMAQNVTNIGNYNGVSYDESAELVELDIATGEMKSSLDEDSWYMKGLDFFFQANQMGLLDPDSMTQRFDDAIGKFSEGRVLFSPWNWATGTFDSPENHAQGMGFMAVEAKDAKILSQQLAPIGKNWSTSVSSATKNPELCMKLINYLATYENAMTIINGPQGVTWDINAEGKPELTENGLDYILDATKQLPGGGKFGDGASMLNAGLFDASNINPEFGEGLGYNLWSTYKEPEDKLRDEWRADYGVKDQLELLRKMDAIAQDPFAPMPVIPDDMQVIAANVGNISKTLSWKMIYAKDQAEFDSLKADLISQAKSAGMDDFYAWCVKAYDEAKAIGAKYE